MSFSADAVKEILRLEAKKVRVRQQGKSAGLSAEEMQPLIDEIDVAVAKIRAVSAAQFALPGVNPTAKK